MLKMIATSILLIVVGAVLLHAQPPTPNGWEDAIAIYNVDPFQTPGTPAIATNHALVNMVHTLCRVRVFKYDELWFRRSTDFGFTWEDATRVSEPSVTVEDGYRIGADGRGNVYAVWYQGGAGNYAIWFAYSTDNGQTWPIRRIINNELGIPPTLDDPPTLSLAVDEADTVRLSFWYHEGADYLLCYSHYYHINPASQWISYETVRQGGYSQQSICSLGEVPHIAFAGGGELFHAVRQAANNWTWNTVGTTTGSYGDPALCSEPVNLLHLAATVNFNSKQPNEIRYYRSTDQGLSWPAGLQRLLFSGFPYHHHPTLANNGGKVMIVVQDWFPSLLYRRSVNSGDTWCEAVCLSTSCGNPRLSSNAFGFFLMFREYSAQNADFTAFYDTLLSSTDMATAANAGRHLYRVPEKNLFNLVYESKGKVRYTRTEGNYVDWQPCHKIDDGCYPSVGYVYVPLGPIQPESATCLAYKSDPDEIRYRFLYEPTGGWLGFSILEPGSGLIPGAPSLITVGYNICVVYPVYNPDRLPRYPFFSAIYFNEFRWDGSGPGTPTILAQSDFLLLNSPCITHDGNYDLHAVWDVNGEIWYRMRASGSWLQAERVDLPPPPPYPSFSPFVETYGDQVFCDWSELPAGYLTETYENWSDIGSGLWDHWANISNSPFFPSDYPVACMGDFSVWAEQNPMLPDYDTRYFSKTWGPGWVGETPARSYYPHAQLWLCDPMEYWHLYTASTEGNTVPYKVATRENLFPGGKGGSRMPVYYKVVTGEPIRSRFCTKRDSTVRYSGFNSDYGKNELIYTLDFLDPLYSSYETRLVTYFEGTSTRTEKVIVDSTDFGSYEVHPNRPETLSITIPRSLYWKDHKVVVTLKGTPVTKAGIIVYQLEKQTSGKGGLSGIQTQSMTPITRLSRLHISPNPVRANMAVTLTAPEPTWISIGLSDITGRLVKTVFVGKTTAGGNVFTVDTKGLSNGVYFLTLKSGKEALTTKVVLVR